MLGAVKNIHFKVSFFVLLLLVATMLIFYLITVQIMSRNILNEVVKRAESLSRSIASSAGYSFSSGDVLGLDNIVFKIKNANKDVEYIAIVDTDNRIIVHNDVTRSGETLSPAKGKLFRKNPDGIIINEVHGISGPMFEIVSPIVFMGKKLGTVLLGINKSVLMNAQNTARNKIMGVFAVILLTGIAGSVVLSFFLTRPIKELSTGVDELKKGYRSRPLKVYSRDELGNLTKSFNEMTSLITEQRERLSEYAHNLEESYIETVKVLAATIDARDPYTHGHSTRVSRLSMQLAKKAGMSREEQEEIKIACLFHDVGKIKIPDSILRKKGALSKAEYDEMMRHTEYGSDILSKAPSLHKYIPPVRHHHEWYNGEGYPDRLSGEQIPVPAAIISIADAFDAITSNRPYRKALSRHDALKELSEASGSQFNPELLNMFIELMNEHDQASSEGSVMEAAS